ncbi:MAG: DUF3467 domain-containing protein [Desulfobacteraceae bacterium]|nr:DUF3467 domain-containing protein [Desulfobacteraceae bacterium]
MNSGDTSTSKKSYPEGNYANSLRVGHNAFEFILDFSQSFDGIEEAEQCIRIITGPGYAKAMLKTLNKAITAYENTFGPIQTK